MAANLNKTASSSNVANGNFEQALGFINISLPNSKGELSKFAAATLKASSDAEQTMFDDLKVSPEMEAEVLAWIKANMVLNFRVNTSGANKGITFGYKKTA